MEFYRFYSQMMFMTAEWATLHLNMFVLQLSFDFPLPALHTLNTSTQYEILGPVFIIVVS